MEEMNRRTGEDRRKQNLGHTPERRSGHDRRLGQDYERQLETDIRSMAARSAGPELSEHALGILTERAKEKFRNAWTVYEKAVMAADKETDADKARGMMKNAQDGLDEILDRIKEDMKNQLQVT
jgi:hypothetical protein